MDDFFNEEDNQMQQQNSQFNDDDFGFNGNDNGQHGEEEEQQQQHQNENFSQEGDDGFDQEDDNGFSNDGTHEQRQQQEDAFEYPVETNVSSTSPVQEWRKKREQQVQELDQASEKKRKELRKAAQEYRKKYLETLEERKKNTHKRNVEQEEMFVQSNQVSHDNIWENVVKYVDIHGSNKKKKGTKVEDDLDDLDQVDLSFKKTRGQDAATNDVPLTIQTEEVKDVSRMRKILLTLKNQPLPEASS